MRAAQAGPSGAAGAVEGRAGMLAGKVVDWSDNRMRERMGNKRGCAGSAVDKAIEVVFSFSNN